MGFQIGAPPSLKTPRIECRGVTSACDPKRPIAFAVTAHSNGAERTQAIGDLAAIFGACHREHGAVHAARFRDSVGLGRKRAIQILEFFDRIGHTRAYATRTCCATKVLGPPVRAPRQSASQISCLELELAGTATDIRPRYCIFLY